MLCPFLPELRSYWQSWVLGEEESVFTNAVPMRLSTFHTGALSFLGGLKEDMNLEAKNGGKRVEENALGRYRVDLIKTYYRNV